jgi:hypothetical protein
VNQIPISADASASVESHASSVAIGAALLGVFTTPACVEQDEAWLVELRSVVEAKPVLPLGARLALRRVVEAVVLEGCSPWQAAQAAALLRRL